MAKFKLSAEQKKFVEVAKRHFDTRLAQSRRKSSAFSIYFLEKCSCELGIEAPRKARMRLLQWKMFGAFADRFDRSHWLARLFRRR